MAYARNLLQRRWPVFAGVGIVLVVCIILLIVLPLTLSDSQISTKVKQDELADSEDSGFFDAPWKFGLVVGGVVLLIIMVVFTIIKLKPAKPIITPPPPAKSVHVPAPSTSTTTGTVTTATTTASTPSTVTVPTTLPTSKPTTGTSGTATTTSSTPSTVPVPHTSTNPTTLPTSKPTTGPAFTIPSFPAPAKLKDPAARYDTIFMVIGGIHVNSYLRMAALIAFAKHMSTSLSPQFPVLVEIMISNRFRVSNNGVLSFVDFDKDKTQKSWHEVAKNFKAENHNAIVAFVNSMCAYINGKPDLENKCREFNEKAEANGLNDVIDMATGDTFLRKF